MGGQAGARAVGEDLLLEPKRCPVCRTEIVEADSEGLVVRNAILRVGAKTGHVRAKRCPRCKRGLAEAPLRYTQ